jgi:hypothetical protein
MLRPIQRSIALLAEILSALKVIGIDTHKRAFSALLLNHILLIGA